MEKKKFADGSAQMDIDRTRDLTLRVAEQVSMRIGNTIGPGGRNYMTPDGITNDGVSILSHIRFSDEREDSIADAFQEVARRQDDDAGDGTTTATVLTAELVKHVLPDVPDIEVPAGGKTVMGLKKELEGELDVALAALKEQKKGEISLDELKKVARTAMEDHKCSDLIAETVFEVGYNSNTAIKEGFSGEVTAEVVPGVHMPLKIETPSMYTNPAAREAAHESPLVIVANHVFESYTELSRFMAEMIAEKKAKKEKPQPIVIVAKHFSTHFTSQIVGTSRQSGLPILLLNANGLTEDEFQDIAVYVNATYIDTHPKEGVSIKDLSYKHAGTCEHLLAGREQTSFTGGQGTEVGATQMRIENLKKMAATEQDPLKRDLLLRRSAGLDGGVATLYVDAKTAVDRYYLKKKVEDGVNSCKAALEHGTLPGGGTALKAVAATMDPEGYLARTLPVIFDRVQKNAGGELTIDIEEVRDSYLTVEAALKNAVAVAKILVTMEGVIADPDLDIANDIANKLGYVG